MPVIYCLCTSSSVFGNGPMAGNSQSVTLSTSVAGPEKSHSVSLPSILQSLLPSPATPGCSSAVLPRVSLLPHWLPPPKLPGNQKQLTTLTMATTAFSLLQAINDAQSVATRHQSGLPPLATNQASRTRRLLKPSLLCNLNYYHRGIPMPRLGPAPSQLALCCSIVSC